MFDRFPGSPHLEALDMVRRRGERREVAVMAGIVLLGLVVWIGLLAAVLA